MRTKNSLLNAVSVLCLYAVKLIFTFMCRTVLIKEMGDVYNGINGLFLNVISMLSIAELGIGTAIIFNLYRPARDNDVELIKSIMCYYKKCYTTIAFVVLILGIVISPFIPMIIGDINIKENVYFVYYLYLTNSVASYFLSYRRSVIYVYQKNYIVSIFDIVYTVISQTLQIAVIKITHGFIPYLIIGISCQILENVIIYRYTNKQYKFLLEKNVFPLPNEIKGDIIKKVKGMLFHNVGSYIVIGTDNILISKIVSVVAVGFYNNYLTVVDPISNILNQIITATQSSIGNLLVEENSEKNYEIYQRLNFFNFISYTVCSVAIYNLVQDFITLWLGGAYLFSDYVVFILVFKFWITGMRNTISAFKMAGGIVYEDRYIPILESLVNIIVSVALGKAMGIGGILLGTIISDMFLFLYSYPFLVYQRLFARKAILYYGEMLTFLFEWIICFIVVKSFMGWLNTMFPSDITFVLLILKGIIVVFVACTIIVTINVKNKNLDFYIQKIFSIIKIHRE